MLRIILLAIFIGFLSSLGHAQEFRLTACPPRTLDGTQIIVDENGGTSCEGKQPVTAYIADLTLRVLCLTHVGHCIAEQKMNTAQRALYERLIASAPKPKEGVKTCTQSGTDWTITMVTGRDIACAPHRHAIRYINAAVNIACVKVGGWTVGCVDLPDTYVATRTQ